MARKDMTYAEAAHAMQTGVRFKKEWDPQDKGQDPKHLRVGVNSAFSSINALTKLLLAKGIFTEEEYKEAVRLDMIREVEAYEKELSELTGKEITLR